MQELFSSKQDFKKLRAEMKKVSPNCAVVPYTGADITFCTTSAHSCAAGLYTKWLVAIEENNRTFLENNLVNLSKLRLIYRLIKEIQNYQSRGPAPYLPSPDLKRTLLSIKPLSEVSYFFPPRFGTRLKLVGPIMGEIAPNRALCATATSTGGRQHLWCLRKFKRLDNPAAYSISISGTLPRTVAIDR